MVNGLPSIPKILSKSDIENARLNNQFVLSGVNPVSAQGANVIAFLEYVDASAAFTIVDSAAATIAGTVATPMNLATAPMRLDGGFGITGTVRLAKGFYIFF